MTARIIQRMLCWRSIIRVAVVAGAVCVAHGADAAILRLSPDTGVYTAGTTFTARVVVNTQGQPINAAEGDLSFNPDDLSVVSISKAGSIFNLWTREPEFSNTKGSISFGGGSPGGYTGSAGTVVTITFRTKHAGTTNVTYAAGSVLAADGKGTNVVSGLQGGSYTVQAASALPQPEYVPPPNTPAAPVITSDTHPDQEKWYRDTTARLAWKLPQGVTALRTLLDDKSSSVPTKVYEEPPTSIEIPDLSQGVSYFHLQFKNADGWGRVAHYRLGVDSEKPTSFEMSLPPDADLGDPEQRVLFVVSDAASGIEKFLVRIDGGDPIIFTDTEKTGIFTTPALSPGDHTIVAEALDYAGNGIVQSFTLSVTSFDKPIFTEYPSELPSTVIPVIRGTTRPHATVEIFVRKVGTIEKISIVHADMQGVFTFVPEGRFEEGVYELYAIATDQRGARSEQSDTVRIAVQQPGFVRVFGMVVSVLSVVVPLIGLLLLLVLLAWYAWFHARMLRVRLRKEVGEAEQSLVHEFDHIVLTLKEGLGTLRTLRKGRIPKQEQDLFSALQEVVENAERKVKKEIEDVERLVKR